MRCRSLIKLILAPRIIYVLAKCCPSNFEVWRFSNILLFLDWMCVWVLTLALLVWRRLFFIEALLALSRCWSYALLRFDLFLHFLMVIINGLLLCGSADKLIGSDGLWILDRTLLLQWFLASRVIRVDYLSQILHHDLLRFLQCSRLLWLNLRFRHLFELLATSTGLRCRVFFHSKVSWLGLLHLDHFVVTCDSGKFCDSNTFAFARLAYKLGLRGGHISLKLTIRLANAACRKAHLTNRWLGG